VALRQAEELNGIKGGGLYDSKKHSLEGTPTNLESRNPLLSFLVLENTKNQEDIRNTRQRLQFLNKRLQSQKNKNIIRYILHNGYWKYKNRHFTAA
jgi:hypothetical protein